MSTGQGLQPDLSRGAPVIMLPVRLPPLPTVRYTSARTPAQGVYNALSEAEQMANPALCKELLRYGGDSIQQVSQQVDSLSLARGPQ